SFITFSNFRVNNLHFGEFIGDPCLDSITVLNNFQESKIIIKNRFPKIARLTAHDKMTYCNGTDILHRIANNIITSDFYNDVQYFIQLKNSVYHFTEKNAIIYKEGNKEIKITLPF